LSIDRIGIANLALQRIKAKRIISSFDEDTTEARAVSTCYETCRDEMLEENPWTFATKRWVLTQLVTAPVFTDDGCTIAYSLPPDFIKATFLSDRSALWKIEAAADGTKILVSDTASLKIKYTFKNDNPDTYSPKFITTLVLRLALELCFKIAEAAKYTEAIHKEYEAALASAISSDSQPGSPDQMIQDAGDRARYIGAAALEEPGSSWWPVIS
jgi:hypothetical protein